MTIRIPYLGLKVVSVALAALLWLTVSSDQSVERALRIPVELINLPPQLEVVGDTPDVVEVRVRGGSAVLADMAPGALVAVLDLQAARPGRRLFHLTGADVRTPFGVEVVQLMPATVPLVFELSENKVVPVVPQVEGEPATGFMRVSLVVEPAMVAITGPASAVREVTEAITEPVSVAGATSTVLDTATVGVTDPSVRLVTPQAARVSVVIVPTAPEPPDAKDTKDDAGADATSGRGAAGGAPPGDASRRPGF
ncbi:MAG: YbbR-like domain-containing protein [Vicinamibacterales bacterium]